MKDRNYRLGVFNGLLFIFSETLLDPTLVLVAFLSQLTVSPVLLGLVVPLRDGAWALPQLWVSGILQTFPRKIVFYQKLSIVRIICWGGLALAINFITNRDVLLVAFFVVYLISSLASGLSGLPFLEIVGKVIPARQRGEFFAWRFGLGGLMGVGASTFVRWLIDPAGPVAFPHNYGILAGMYFVLASSSLILFNQVDEPPDAETRPRASFMLQFKRSLEFFKNDRNLRRFVLMWSALIVAAMATPFFAVYVQQELNGSKAMVGIYLGVLAVTNLLSNIFFGRVSRRFGNRVVMTVTTLTGTLMSLGVLALAVLAKPLGISAQAASNWLIPVFVLSGIRTTGIGVSGNSLLLDIAPVEARSLYIGLTNTILGMVIFLTGFSGVLILLVGFKMLVAVTLVAHIFAFVSIRKMLDRHG